MGNGHQLKVLFIKREKISPFKDTHVTADIVNKKEKIGSMSNVGV